ncbi:MAG TPA: hypothetical protein VH640_26705 [Bryobacteraceae bacterium]
MAGRLKITQVDANFVDQNGRPVAVYELSGRMGFHGFVYQCRLNLDYDGAPKAYGYNNPAAKNSAGRPNLQKDLDPLENWNKGGAGISAEYSQKVGLGNACGDPGDGTKGHVNFLAGNRNFYWCGVMSLTRQQYQARVNALKDKANTLGYVLDDRDELEAGREGVGTPMKAKGQGYFPLVQDSGDSAGYYISTTSVIADNDPSKAYSPSRYLDATKVPYAVWAGLWSRVAGFGGLKLNQGDFGIAILPKTGAHTGYVYGESGTPNELGESSPALHAALGISSELVAFIALPGSGSGKVLGINPQDQIRPRVRMRSAALGSDALDLATFLATGQVNPKYPAKMTSAQARTFNNIYAALTDWTLVTMEPSESYGSRAQPLRYL